MLIKFIKAYYQYLIVLIVAITLFKTNYVSHTTLMGWDNLQTDLNPFLGIKRSLFAAWQEYQSFGLPSGLSHSADLVRSIFIWIISLFLPSNLLRYTFIFLMVFVGGIGMLKLLGSNDNNKKAFSILGALFYILNYGTIQISYLPWESFSIFFAFLPWEIWIFLKLLNNPRKRLNWVLLLMINFLASPQAYVQTIFIVYILILLCFAFGYCLEKKSIKVLKDSFIIVSLILIINSFWILPQTYSFITRSDIVTSAKNNILSTENVLYQNLEKGTLWHFFKMEGFYSDLYGRSKTFLFQPWKEHFNHLPIVVIALFLSLISLIGIAGSILKKTSYRFAYLSVFALIAFALLGKVFPFDKIHDLLSNYYLINQIFRSSFTKFIIPYAFVASYGFAMGASILYNLLLKHTSLKIAKSHIVIFFSFLIFIYALPSFTGNYISSEMKVVIPSSYLQAIKFFEKEDKNKRITLLPNYTSWGWFNYKWGYTGSGFLWYGIEQPIVSRTFDVWSNNSESYYWEEKEALEADDVSKFQQVLEKYNIDYILYDKSLSPIVGNAKAIQQVKLSQMLEKSNIITQIKNWGDLSIYKVNHEQKVNTFVEVSPSLPNIGPGITLTNRDTAYLNYGKYMTTSEKPFDVYFPFLNLTTQSNIVKKAWNIFELPSEWIFTASLPFKSSSYSYNFTSQNEFNLYLNGKSTKLLLPLSSAIGKDTLILRFPKIKISDMDIAKSILENCSPKGSVDKKNQENSILINARNGATGCITYTDPNLNQKYGYLVKVANKNISGQRLFFYILDNTKEQIYLEDRLKKDVEDYIIAPKFEQGTGYSFIFNNNSYENIESINKLDSLETYLLPYDAIKNISLQKANVVKRDESILDIKFDVKKINYYSYLVSGESLSDKTLILHQSFEPGWKAYSVQNSKGKMQNWLNTNFPFFFGKELREHVLVNNWANGWILNNYTLDAKRYTLAIIFWPQYLEYLGLLILGGAFTVILVIPLKGKPA